MKFKIQRAALLLAEVMLAFRCAKEQLLNKQAEKEAILLQKKRFVGGLQPGGCDNGSRFYTRDAYSLAPGSRLWKGHRAFREGLIKELTETRLLLEVQTVSPTFLGEHGSEVGTFAIQVTLPGSETNTEEEKYLTTKTGRWSLATPCRCLPFQQGQGKPM